MKKIAAVVLGILAFASIVYCQDNTVADSIVGEYFVDHQGETSKVRITKEDEGTYKAQVFWVKTRTDKEGNVRLDEKNPDKSLRHVPCDQIVLISGLKHNAEKQRWDDTKVYDPTRGIRANVTCEFVEGGKLKIKGSLLGFSQTVFWQKMD
ncbi:MAG: DUF2147 domain-containing protein [Candidatus Cryptobacteroides sp.]